MSTARPLVVVGYDGSPAARHALAWAADEAARTGRDLRVLHALGHARWGADAVPQGVTAGPGAAAAAQRWVTEALAVVGREAPEVHATGEVVEGSAPGALVRASADASLVVVGSRGRGGFASLLLGSTSTGVALHAHCPVVVVKDDRDGTAGTEGTGTSGGAGVGVVVGVDGSPLSLVALDHALRAASSRKASLTVLHAHEPAAVVTEDDQPRTPERDAFAVAEQRALEEIVEDARTAAPDVAVTATVVEGHAVTALVEAARGASLVVLGSRGRGGFADLVLGSTAQGVLHHATCPVLLVRDAA